MEVRILGEFGVRAEDGHEIDVFGRRQRTLLALLATRAGVVVSSDAVIDALWGLRPPANQANAVQTVMSRLRQSVGGCVVTQWPGYVLRVGVDGVDASRFERLADEGHHALAHGDVEAASEDLHEALSLWRGAPLAEFVDSDFARLEAMRLEERRISVLEDRIDADLALGRHRDVAGELEVLASANPLRERLQGHRLLALYRSGRQAEALARYRELADLLRDAHGLDPGRALRELERRMLQQDPALDPVPAVSADTTPASSARDRAREPTRRIVTAVVVDLDGFDDTGEPPHGAGAELHRGSQIRLMGAVLEALAAHGGVVERLPGGAVGAFGLDRAHEDDAARAVRAGAAAAALLRTVAATLADRPRPPHFAIGIASGELVADTDWYLAASPVSEARRLASTAPAGDVFVDALTVRLARDVTDFEPRPPPRTSFRLGTLPGLLPRARRLRVTPFVNREHERAVFAEALQRATREQRTQVVTVLGLPGVGKSRLIREFLDGVAAHATIAVGRSLSYGESTSTFTVGSVVRCLVGEQIAPGLAARLSDVERGPQIADRVAAAIGAGGRGGTGEEIQWALRRLFETVAAERPLIVALDDLHWAEPWLLDLIEYLKAFAIGPIVLVACARPDLLESRPHWAGPEAPSELMLLQPLSDTHTQQLVEGMLLDHATPPGAVARITQRSEGNPLFAEQIVAFEVDHSFAAGNTVPTTLRSLLQERVDDLRPAERDLLTRAAVEGVVFHRGALMALAEPGEQSDQGAAMALMRKGFIAPANAQVAGEDAFRFRHALLRDAVYEALPKEQRARLHVRFADWLGQVAPDHALLGHHLRTAWLYTDELHAGEGMSAVLGSRAAKHAVAAAEAAVARSALPAAIELYRQAAEMLPRSAPERTRALVELGSTLLTTGDLAGAGVALASAREEARTSGHQVGEAYAQVLDLQLQLQIDPDVALVRIPRATGSAALTFRRHHDDLGMCRLHHTRALAHWFACRCQAAADDWMRAATHARRSGRAGVVPENILAWVASALHQGPEPVPSAIERCEQLLGEMRDYPLKQAAVRRQLGVLYAMDGEFSRAHAALGESARLFDEMGNTVHSAARDREADAAMLEGDTHRAEQLLRESIERLDAMGDRLHLPVILGLLARTVMAQGDADEADSLTRTTEQLAARYDVSAQVSWRTTRARVLTQRGAGDEAVRIAREAVALVSGSDWLLGRADAAESLAAALDGVGRDAEAYHAAAGALSLFEQKGARVLADAARAGLNLRRQDVTTTSVADRQR